MKRKTLITSILVIVLCLALISGSTYSLFTSESSVNIAVTSGKVEVVATIDPESLKVYSANSTMPTGTPVDKMDPTDTTGKLTGTFAGTYYYEGPLSNGTFKNGGTAKLSNENTVLTIDKITPGDKVTVKVNVENKSNVKTKYRIRVNVLDGTTIKEAAESLKLFEGLVVKVGTNDAEPRTATTLDGVIRVSNWYTLDEREANSTDNLADVPVEIFLPLDAGNEYQNLKTEIQITVEAVQSNASTALLDSINAILIGSTTKKNNTMYEAIQEVVANTQFTATDLYGFVWSVDDDLFYAETDVEESFEYKYFKAYTQTEYATLAKQTFSVYAYGTGWTTVDDIKVGFDAGETSGITSITYDRSAATYGQEVVIRTNSAGTTLTVNAPKDTVKHYDNVGTLNIIAAANASYHEYGKVAFAEIKTGRIVLESESEVEHVHLTATGTGSAAYFNDITVAKASNVDMPDFSRDPVDIPEEGKLVVALQKGTNEDDDKDYVWLTAVGIYEQVTVSDSDTQAKDNYAATSTTVTQEQQTAAQQIANNITFSNNNVDYKVTATKSGDVWTYEVKTKAGEDASASYTATASGNTVTVQTTGANPEEVQTKVENGLTESQKESVQFVATLFEGGKGTSTDPYLISTFNALLNVDAVSTGSETLYYRVVENLVADDATTSWANGFLYKDPATYVIDLNKNTLTVKNKPIFGYAVNLEIYNGTINYTGGAAFVDLACDQNMDSYNMNFHDLVLTGEIENSETHYGPLVSYAFLINSGNASFNASNIVNNLTINNKNSDGYTGGLFGYIQGSAVSCSITNCTFNGTIVSPHAAPFINTCSAPKTGVTSENNTFNGRLLATKDVHLFGCNGNVTGGSATLAALASSVTEGDNAVKTVLPASTTLISLSDKNEVVLNKVEDASTYRVAVLFMVNNVDNGTGGYPRYITVDKAQFESESVNTGIYRYAIHQVTEDESAGKTVVTNQSGTLIWIESDGYHVYQPSYELSNSKATIYAYAYDVDGNIITYQTIPYSYE